MPKTPDSRPISCTTQLWFQFHTLNACPLCFSWITITRNPFLAITIGTWRGNAFLSSLAHVLYNDRKENNCKQASKHGGLLALGKVANNKIGRDFDVLFFLPLQVRSEVRNDEKCLLTWTLLCTLEGERREGRRRLMDFQKATNEFYESRVPSPHV